MQFDVLQTQALPVRKFAQSARLVNDVVEQFAAGCLYVAPAKSDQITKTWVCTNAHPMLFGIGHHSLHDVRVASVKTGCDVGGADLTHDGFVCTLSDTPWAKSLPHVRIQIHHSFHCFAHLCSCTWLELPFVHDKPLFRYAKLRVCDKKR